MNHSIVSRKLCGLEKLPEVFHDEAGGSTIVGVIIKVNRSLNFGIFKSAWEVLFHRHPMLRATVRNEAGQCFFDFNAKFSDIPLSVSVTADRSQIEKIYGQDVIELLDSQHYLWRAALVQVPNTQAIYIIFGGAHSICDIKSVSSLLNELLNVVDELEANIMPHRESQVIPPPLDDILDKSRFSPEKAIAPSVMSIDFDAPATIAGATSHNILKTIEGKQFESLKNACTAQGTTVTAALCTALALAARDVRHADAEKIVMSTAMDLRPYTTTQVTPEVLAFYAHMLGFDVDVRESSFWELTKCTKKIYSDAIQAYSLPNGDDAILFESIKNGVHDSVANNKFMVSYCVTNVGKLDAIFAAHPEVESCHFTVTNKSLFVMILAATAINNRLCLNFNYTSPAMTDQAANALAERTLWWLSEVAWE